MEFRVLGPLEVVHDGHEVSPRGSKPRALLALLLLHPNEVVPSDRLIDELWGEDAPADAATALRVNVSRLRKALPARRAADEIARLRPQRKARAARPAPLRAARRRGTRACSHEAWRPTLRSGCTRRSSLWRGPALADFAYEGFAEAAIARLEEIRLAAVELRVEADLALGRHERAGRRARGARRRAPAPRTPPRTTADGAVPVGAPGGRSQRVPGRASGARRRARGRPEPGAPGAAAGDPAAGPLTRPPPARDGHEPAPPWRARSSAGSAR